MKPAILILDCGATNAKACVVDINGQIIASESIPNQTSPDPYFEGGLIWDIDQIWEKLGACSRKICNQIKETEIKAVTVTTFGVDGAAVKRDGRLCYPVISWQCSRTQVIEKNIGKYFDPLWLYEITGLQSYHFNTLFKLIWLKENKPEVLEQMDYYVMMPSLILYRISGEFVTDTTMAGTSMLTSYKNRAFAPEIMNTLGLETSIFPVMKEPGTIIGQVRKEAAEILGIKEGVPVIISGHDTQFAILGSGAGENQPVLSSGTWEILMVRSLADKLDLRSQNSGVTVELDTQPGLVNVGVQWVASGVLEWVSKILYPGISGNVLYSSMIQEAKAVPAGSKGLLMIPELFPGGFSGKPGTLQGFTHETSRSHIYRAALEALTYYLRHGLEMLEHIGNYNTKDVICVGGGSKNSFWNQIRTDVLGIPLKVLNMNETTALGAALTAFTGLGIYKNIEEAVTSSKLAYSEYLPGKESQRYNELYRQFEDRVFK